MPTFPRRVAMFDSGLGGLTVLSALRALISGLDVVYYADTAHVPYGDRTLHQVSGFARKIIQHLESYEPAVIAIACGTSNSSFEALGWPKSPVPLVGLIEPGAQAACAATRNRAIGVIATNATAKSGVFERAILDRMPEAVVKSVGAPALVPIVETGAWATKRARAAVSAYCGGLTHAGCDTVVLGCTHYPHLMAWFVSALGVDVQIVDPGAACAQVAARLLAAGEPQPNRIVFEVSGDPKEFAAKATLLSGVRIDEIRQVAL